MRFVVPILLASLLPCGIFAQPAKLTPDSSLDQILDALDARGQGLKSFTADVKLAETTTDFGATTTRFGKVWYQDQGDGKARIRVSFDAVDRGNGRQVKEKLDYKLEDGQLVERNHRTKSQNTQQVLRPGEQLNLLKLGEGPFPLPIGQPKAEVYKRFTVKKIAPAKDDPPGTVHVQLIPNAGTRFERQFMFIDAWVDGQSHMPVRIGTRDKNETMDRTTDLSNVQINPPLEDRDFTLESVDLSGWNVTHQAYEG